MEFDFKIMSVTIRPFFQLFYWRKKKGFNLKVLVFKVQMLFFHLFLVFFIGCMMCGRIDSSSSSLVIYVSLF